VPQEYTLVVQDPAEERQLRRLGAAVSLLWTRLPPSVQDELLIQASMIHISGENSPPGDLKDAISKFLERRGVGHA